MNWRKRSVGLNSIESNNLDEMILTQSNCKSCLDFIDKSVSFVNLFVTIKSKQQHQSIQCYLDYHSKIPILIRKLKIAAISTTLQLDQVKSNICQFCILYTYKNAYLTDQSDFLNTNVARNICVKFDEAIVFFARD